MCFGGCTNSGLVDRTVAPTLGLSNLPSKKGGEQGGLVPGTIPLGTIPLAQCPPRHDLHTPAPMLCEPGGSHLPRNTAQLRTCEQDLIRKRETAWQACLGREGPGSQTESRWSCDREPANSLGASYSGCLPPSLPSDPDAFLHRILLLLFSRLCFK